MPKVRFEVVPDDSGDADDPQSVTARLLRAFPEPQGVTLTVTSLPRHGIERTIQAAVRLADSGFAVVPHVPARSIADRAQLRNIVLRMHAAGIVETFAVSGDARTPAGEYSTSLELIRDIAELDPVIAVGVAGYPEGHPEQSDERLMKHLLDRAPYIDKVVSQLCFSPEAVAGYAERLRAAGVDAAFWAGVAGPVSTDRLARLSDTLGVGPSKTLLRDATDPYDPLPFIAELRRRPGPGGDALDGLHVYTFDTFDGLPAIARAVTVEHA